MTRTARKALAWLLIVTLGYPFNPAQAQVPAAGAGDFTIFSSPTFGGAAKPNILLILDTSDSMNIYEPWKEYPGPYDSHVEYLWNDKEYVGSIQ